MRKTTKSFKIHKYLPIIIFLFVLSFCINSNAGINDGLIAYYPFNGNANDESGNGNHGTVSGATLTTDRCDNTNNAYSFDGSDYIEIDDSSSFEVQNLTISLWLSLSDGNNSPNFFNKDDYTKGYQIGVSGPKLYFMVGNGVWHPIYVDNDLENNTWYHLVGTYDGNTLKFYLNSSLIDELEHQGGISYGNNNLFIGANGYYLANPDHYMNGKIDDIRVYNRALSETEIDDLYNECGSSQPADKIFLRSGGSLNGTSISTSNPAATVTEGESITGTVNIQVQNDHDAGAVVPVVYTPTWGDHASSYVQVDSWADTGTSNYDVDINLTAPNTAGSYYLIFASAGQTNASYVASFTQWTVGTPSWDDGNDLADYTESDMSGCLTNGYAPVSDLLSNGSHAQTNYGMTYIKIIVEESSSPCTDSDEDGYYAESGCGTEVDCNDSDEDINPGATEVCDDEIDNDCNDTIDCNDASCESEPACDGDPLLSVSPASIDFEEADSTATISISNTGKGTLTWSASDDATWLTLSPTGGQATTETDKITATCSRTGQSEGSHTATITISSNAGDKTIPVVMTVPVPGDDDDDDLEADFDGCTDYSDELPLHAQFYDTSSGDVVAWEWSFGDGGSSYEQNPLHSYDACGKFTVQLTVTDADGNEDNILKDDCVRITGPDCVIEADFMASPTSGCYPLTVQFTDQSEGPVTGYSWNFGDGVTSDDENPSHTYNDKGTYSVTLTVSGAGAESIEQKVNLISTDEPCECDIEICGICLAVTDKPSGMAHVKTLREFRDSILAAKQAGKMITRLYYDHTQEIVDILTENPELKEDVASLVMELSPRLSQILKGNRTAVTQAELEQIQETLKALAAQGSTLLKTSINFIQHQIADDAFLKQFGIIVVE